MSTLTDFQDFLPYIGTFDVSTQSVEWQGRRPSLRTDSEEFLTAVQSKLSFVHIEPDEEFTVDVHTSADYPDKLIVVASRLKNTESFNYGDYTFQSQVLRFMSQSVIVSDLEQRILVWNYAAERIYGWKADEVLGKKIEDIQFSQTYAQNTKGGFYDKLKESGEIQLEGRHVRRNGEEFPVRIFNSALYDSNGQLYAIVSVTSDISEEKKVKSDLLAGQQEIELLFNNTMYGAFFMMLDEPIEWGPHVDKEAVLDYVFEHQRVTRINQAMLDQYRATEDQFIGTLPKDFFAHNIEEGREIWRKFFDLGRWRVETDERRMDGTRVIFEGDYFLLHNDDGKIIGHFGVQQDVTARKENEERLRISEKKLKKLTENVPGVIFEFVRTVEGEFYFDFLSEGIEEFLLGVPSDELYENIQSAFDLIHADDLEMVYSQLAETKPNEQLTFEFRIKSETGDYLWLRSISNSELLPNGEMRWYGIFEDITEEKRQKKELQKLALVAQNTSDHISICNEDGTIFWINTEKESLIGYTRDELLGSSFLDLVKKHSRDTNKFKNIGEAFYYKNSFKEHMHMVRKDEEFCHIEYRGTAIFDKNKQFKYFLIVSRDVTEIYEKQNELIRAISLTKEQNARLKEFTYIISHNVRSHSANFTSLTGLLAKESDPKEQNAIVHLLVTVSENLEQTIQHLNSIVSVNEESMNSYDYLTLKPLTESALTNMNQEIIQTDTEINIEIEKDLKVYGVPAYLESILHNLISNAIKYRHPDRRPVVTINARNTGNGVEMVVADNGLGMDLETYGDKLFGMYRTFHNNKNARGIGLYLTKNQIDAMGAEIFVNSEVDKGTIFQLFFPDDYAN